MTISKLVPLAFASLGRHSCLTVDAAVLHGALGVKRPFMEWIQARIKRYDCVESQDFAQRFDLVAPLSGSGSAFPASVRYLLSLDMAKMLCMAENSVRGRELRRYLMEQERGIAQAAPSGKTAAEIIAEQEQKIADNFRILEERQDPPACPAQERPVLAMSMEFFHTLLHILEKTSAALDLESRTLALRNEGNHLGPLLHAASSLQIQAAQDALGIAEKSIQAVLRNRMAEEEAARMKGKG